MNNLIKKISDNKNPLSIASKFRGQRHAFFLKLLRKSGYNNILDIGGTQNYWDRYKNDIADYKITLLNLMREEVDFPNFSSTIGNATDLKEYSDKSVGIVFSNSVIEHLFTKENQIKMANEIERIGESYFIQTPNKFFPLEPHFLFPFYQFLPNFLKLFLLRNFSLGHIGKIPDMEKAQNQIDEIRLLSKSEFQAMFPEGRIYEEKILFMTKSFVAYKF